MKTIKDRHPSDLGYHYLSFKDSTPKGQRPLVHGPALDLVISCSWGRTHREVMIRS